MCIILLLATGGALVQLIKVKKFYWSDRLNNCSDLSRIKDNCVRL